MQRTAYAGNLEHLLSRVTDAAALVTTSLTFGMSAASVSKLRDSYRMLDYAGDCLPMVVNLLSGPAGLYLENLGKNTGCRLLENIGRYLPETASALFAAYIVAYETGIGIAQKISEFVFRTPNTPDIVDIPLPLITVLGGYYLARRFMDIYRQK